MRGVGIIYFLDSIGSIHGAERSPLDRRFMNPFVLSLRSFHVVANGSSVLSRRLCGSTV